MENQNLLPLTPVLLPTEEASELWFISMPNNPNWLHLHPRNVKARVPNQHLYLTSDREIKEGDWIERLGKAYKINKFSSDREYRRAECSDGLVCDASKEDWGNKIEFTTAPQLISDGVYEIPENIWMLHSLPLFDKSEHNSYLQINLLEEFVKRYNRNAKGVDVVQQLEDALDYYIKQKHTQEECVGFIAGFGASQALQQSNAGGFSLEQARKIFEAGSQFGSEKDGSTAGMLGFETPSPDFNTYIQSLTPKQGEIEMWCEMERYVTNPDTPKIDAVHLNYNTRIKLINGEPIIHFNK